MSTSSWSSTGASETAPAGADDYLLMEGVRGRDSSALATLYDRYSPVVFAMCQRALRDRMDAEDLLIDIFSEVWERSDRYDPSRGTPAGYLLGLARSRVVDRLRSKQSKRRQAQQEMAGDPSDLADARGGNGGGLDTVLLSEQRQRVRRALDGLPKDQRQAVELAFFDCLTHTEVAETLSEPLGTIKSRIRQGLIHLRNVLGGDA